MYTTDEESRKCLQVRFDEAVAVTGTHQFHAFLPVSTEDLATKAYSASEETVLHRIKITPRFQDVHFDNMTGFVACTYDNSWWMQYTLSMDAVEREVKISFLHPAGPATSFSYPRKPDVLTMPGNFILCKLDPITATGRTYQLTPQEMTKASSMLVKKKDILYH